MTKCPCCGHEMDTSTIDKMLPALSPLVQRIVQAVRYHPGISGTDLAAIVYQNDPNGGPDNANRTIRTRLSQSRAVMTSYGWQLTGWERGRPLGYYLKRIETPDA